MRLLAGFGGALLLAIVLWDAFETIILPRRVNRRLRLTRAFYRATWTPWAASARLVRAGNRRELFLSFYGPLSLVLLLALWAAGLVTGFGLLQYANGSTMHAAGNETVGFTTDLYLSGTTFFTLGLGDVAPQGSFARLLRGRIGPGLRVPRDRDRLLPGDLSGVLAAGGSHLAARRAGGLAAQRRRAAAPPWRR